MCGKKKTVALPGSTGPGRLHLIPCDKCRGTAFRSLFNKKSEHNEIFRVVRCKRCGLVQINPQPDRKKLRPYYNKNYFTRRTARGYNNYFSHSIKNQINAVFEMNLSDLHFYDFEKKTLTDNRNGAHALDAGCAAGYFVELLTHRGWQAQGIELSEEAATFGRDNLGLNIIIDDFLTCKKLKSESFSLITFWASIEHMQSPRQIFERSYDLLKPNGRLLISTCRYGLLARIMGFNWRFMNVPEHLYFFDRKGLKELAAEIGFRTIKSITYGSGFTTRPESGPLYKLIKKIADPLVKILQQGDMMAFHFKKL